MRRARTFVPAADGLPLWKNIHFGAEDHGKWKNGKTGGPPVSIRPQDG